MFTFFYSLFKKMMPSVHDSLSPALETKTPRREETITEVPLPGSVA